MAKSLENLKKRKPTGGRRKAYRSRRTYESDNYPAETILGEKTWVVRRSRGGNMKISLRRIDVANVYDPSTKASTNSKIVSAVSNAANRDFQRRGVITKGAVIETEAGKARVTSRPGQDGVVNAILVK
ncbi:MAG: 30S ribosomal protein S8e [Thaumarchaeota archaeon]|nr:30S ribosomal protein S8e [Nitrososphaerota archaeon]